MADVERSDLELHVPGGEPRAADLFNPETFAGRLAVARARRARAIAARRGPYAKRACGDTAATAAVHPRPAQGAAFLTGLAVGALAVGLATTGLPRIAGPGGVGPPPPGPIVWQGVAPLAVPSGIAAHLDVPGFVADRPSITLAAGAGLWRSHSALPSGAVAPSPVFAEVTPMPRPVGFAVPRSHRTLAARQAPNRTEIRNPLDVIIPAVIGSVTEALSAGARAIRDGKPPRNTGSRRGRIKISRGRSGR